LSKKFIHIAFFFFPWLLFSQSTHAPILQRACLNRVNSELTLLLRTGRDTCSGFKFYRLWGRTDALASFELLDQATDFNLLTWNVLLPNKKRWELYVSAHYPCANKDSFKSNLLFIDDVPPSYVEPDSVSIDFISQHMIAGWTNPPETDVMGYSLFKVDGAGNNLLIDEQNVSFYSFEVADFNGQQSGNRLAIAAYDSCRNGGVISSFHSPVLLQTSVGPNYLCDKRLQLNWTAYKGWDVGEYQVIIRDKSRNVVLKNTRVSGGTLNYVYPLPYLDVTLDIYVRAYKSSGSVTSTSNRQTQFVADFIKPSKSTSLYFASVIDDNTISIEGYANPGDSIDIQYQSGFNAWTSTRTYPMSPGTFAFNHLGSRTQESLVNFRVIRYNRCDEPADSSLPIRTIFLEASDRSLNWNDNQQWALLSGSFDYSIEKESNSSWSSVGRTFSNNFELPPFGSYWVRIKGESNLWSAEKRGYTYSNPILVDLGFDSSLMDTLLIPNAFTPEGINPNFKISNPAIQLGESQLSIYNRWGQLLYYGDALEGWDGRVSGTVVSDGVYVYKVTALYRQKRIEKSGTLLLLR
jgi:gliding motility-associated-like protein